MSATVASLEREIREVGEEVRKVECKIDEVEQRIDCSDGKEKEQLRIKEEHATKEKEEQLREKDLLLLKMKPPTGMHMYLSSDSCVPIKFFIDILLQCEGGH